MLHSWDEAKPPAVKHPADIVAQGRASGQGGGVPSSARTRSGCRETLTSVARDPLSQGQCLKVSWCLGEQFLGSLIHLFFFFPLFFEFVLPGWSPILRERSRRARTL